MASTCKISILGWVSVVLVSLPSVYCLAVPRTGSKSTLTKPLEIPRKKVLIVENTMRPSGSGVSAFKTNGTVNALFCEHAGPAPHIQDITVGAVSWGCYAVKPGVATIPAAVYKMKRSNSTLWHALKEHCGCSFMLTKFRFSDIMSRQEVGSTQHVKYPWEPPAPVLTRCIAKSCPNRRIQGKHPEGSSTPI